MKAGQQRLEAWATERISELTLAGRQHMSMGWTLNQTIIYLRQNTVLSDKYFSQVERNLTYWAETAAPEEKK